MTGQTCTRVRPTEDIKTDPSKLGWGVVATVKAPLPDIARFAAWHLDMGAAQIDLYLDDPDLQTAEILNAHAKITAVICDDAYWAKKPAKARTAHQLRQAHNASRSYRHSDLDWLAHIDVDEFLLTEAPMACLLAEAPADCAFLQFPPAELLTHDGPTSHFKRTPKAAGHSKSILGKLYPEFGDVLPQGFISHTAGKLIARTGLDSVRFGIHHLLTQGHRIANGHTPAGCYIGHAHARDFAHFRQHMAYRLAHGSYRNQINGNRHLNALLTMLEEEQGSEGLQRFYEEVCTARPALVDHLRRHNMLVVRDMALDAAASRHFGNLPRDPESST